MRYLICLILLFSASLQAGSILKWVDEEGNVHYGDAPPISAVTKPVRVIGGPSNPGKALPRLGNDNDNPEATSDANSETSNELPQDQAKVACDEAQKDLKVISSSNRVKLKSADGTERYMTTEEIAERRKIAEADIEKYCR